VTSPPASIAGRAPRLSILTVASEVAPWSKSGGLADVTAALPAALASLGHQVTVVTPLYQGVRPPAGSTRSGHIRLGTMAHDVIFHTADLMAGLRLVFVECPAYFDRAGYYGAGGRDYSDNAFRFGLLAAAALDVAETAARPFDVVHAHDWEAGLVPTLLAADPARWPATSPAGRVFTVHNLAYQGLFPGEIVGALGLPWKVFGLDGGEFWNEFSFLKAGINYSDFVTTVSPGYARETLTPEFGAGFDGVLAGKGWRYSGILNGIDTVLWDPATDPLLPAHFDRTNLAGKAENKRALLDQFGLTIGDDAMERPLIGMVSRLVAQKGVDLVIEGADRLMALDASWVFVGTGEARYAAALERVASTYRRRVGVLARFNETVAHLVEAGADIFLMPSRFEPCGLNQMYSLRYGTVPIVHAVGGLDDTIRPVTSRARHANGFKFHEPTAAALVRSVRQAVRMYRDRPRWRLLMEEGMTDDHSWTRSAREYVKVYRRARYDASSRRAMQRQADD
jgi:starch synthase